MRNLTFSLALSAIFLPGLSSAEIDFNRDIRPILSDKCYACHGPDEHTREANLRLDTYEGATMELDGYKALDPEALEDSEILFRIETDDKTGAATRIVPVRHGGKLAQSGPGEVA